MASTNINNSDVSAVKLDPNFAIICTFFEKFSKLLKIEIPNFYVLEKWLKDSSCISPELKNLHIKLLRKTRRTVHESAWEVALSKFCYSYSSQDAWEIERFGYKNSNSKVKIRLLKELLESQFERNGKFRADLVNSTGDSLRSEPIGRDRFGNIYWFTQDNDCNFRIYKEHLDKDSWQIVATNREEFCKVIERLKANEDIPCIEFEDDDSDDYSTNTLNNVNEMEANTESDNDESKRNLNLIPSTNDNITSKINNDLEENKTESSKSDFKSEDNLEENHSLNIVNDVEANTESDYDESEKNSNLVQPDSKSEDNLEDNHALNNVNEVEANTESDNDESEKTSNLVSSTNDKITSKDNNELKNNKADSQSEDHLDDEAEIQKTCELSSNLKVFDETKTLIQLEIANKDDTNTNSKNSVKENENKDTLEPMDKNLESIQVVAEKNTELDNVEPQNNSSTSSDNSRDGVVNIKRKFSNESNENSDNKRSFTSSPCKNENDQEFECTAAVEDPPLYVKGEGVGEECDMGTTQKDSVDVFICSEAIEEPTVYIFGEGSGVECEMGDTKIEIAEECNKPKSIIEAKSTYTQKENAEDLPQKVDDSTEEHNVLSRKRRLSTITMQKQSEIDSDSSSKSEDITNTEDITNDIDSKRIKMRPKAINLNARKKVEKSRLANDSSTDDDNNVLHENENSNALKKLDNDNNVFPKKDNSNALETVEDKSEDQCESDIDPLEIKEAESSNKKENISESKLIEHLSDSEKNLTFQTKKKYKPQRQRDIDTSNIIDAETDAPIRQSRRIAQIKIKEEAERRKLEEVTLQKIKCDFKKKRKKNSDDIQDPSISTPSENEYDINDDIFKEKIKRKHDKKRKTNGWSSGSEELDEDDEPEPEHYDSDRRSVLKSDHEFSPESDLEDDTENVPLKRARTVRKVDDIYNEGFFETDEACLACGKTDNPEFILLCDSCDKGYHCSCLSPVLHHIPDGDWFCPTCQQKSLIAALESKLQQYDLLIEQKEREKLIKIEEEKEFNRLQEEKENIKKNRNKNHVDSTENSEDEYNERQKKRIRKNSDCDGDNIRKTSKRLQSNASSSNSSASTDCSDDEPIYKLRKRKQINVRYRLNEFDNLIKTALKEEIKEETEDCSTVISKGKDMNTIIKEENKHKRSKETDVSTSDDEHNTTENAIKKPNKSSTRKKNRKLNSLNDSSESDDSDEDFRTSSFDDEDEDDSASAGSESSSDLKSYSKRKSSRRAARERRKIKQFIADSDDESDVPLYSTRRDKKKHKAVDIDVSDEEDDDSTDDSEDIDSSELCDDSSESDKNSKKKPVTTKPKKPPVNGPKKKRKIHVKEEPSDDSEDGTKPVTNLKSNSSSDNDSVTGSRKTRGRRFTYLEDLDDSSDGGIKPGVQRPDTPPEEREKFIKKQEEIKRMLAEKNLLAAKIAATPRLSPIKDSVESRPEQPDSLSTVPLSVIRQAKVLDIDYLQRKGETPDSDENSDEFDDGLPDDFNPEDMDEEAIAKMMEEEDFATHQLKLAGEAIKQRKEQLADISKKNDISQKPDSPIDLKETTVGNKSPDAIKTLSAILQKEAPRPRMRKKITPLRDPLQKQQTAAALSNLAAVNKANQDRSINKSNSTNSEMYRTNVSQMTIDSKTSESNIFSKNSNNISPYIKSPKDRIDMLQQYPSNIPNTNQGNTFPLRVPMFQSKISKTPNLSNSSDYHTRTGPRYNSMTAFDFYRGTPPSVIIRNTVARTNTPTIGDFPYQSNILAKVPIAPQPQLNASNIPISNFNFYNNSNVDAETIVTKPENNASNNKSSEFSGLVSYFSSQHDDLNET